MIDIKNEIIFCFSMETFPEVSSQMLYEFEALLQHSPSPIGDVRLLQLLAINMFAIDNATAKAGLSHFHGDSHFNIVILK